MAQNSSSNKWIWLVGIGLVVFFLAKQKVLDFAQRFDIGTPSINSGVLGWLSSQLRINLPVINHTGITANVNDFQGIISYNGTRVANLNLYEISEIPTNGTGNIVINADVNNVQFITDLIRNLPTQPVRTPFIIEGTLTIEGISIPISQTLHIPDYV